MIFGAHELVRDLSHYLTLEPGDVINSGTPRASRSRAASPTCGNCGDVVELDIDHLGHQRQHMRPARPA